MRDKIGEYHDDLDSIFSRLLILENKVNVLTERVLWLEEPDKAPKPKAVKPKEIEGKL
jgi:hypothetical protein